ncbi:nuclear transport factor 2 family protein [Streptomyces fulvoviolaceus]|uniref:nuclear transport factor 2 family protein n=1 Tax=Streptomyces fulvoviolaceus TaxID=285535 RepID=UPI00069403A7|nr:nuclear transport factor 2 family protein [Streptomyces fulvoviolaceus]
MQALIERYAAGDTEAAYALYADDAEVSMEFAVPERIVTRGTEQWGTQLSRMYSDIKVRDLTLYDTTDPNVVIAEWTYVSRIGESTVSNGNIIVVECRNGKIVRSRDYHDHVARAVADGDVPSLVSLVEGMVLPQDKEATVSPID